MLFHKREPHKRTDEDPWGRSSRSWQPRPWQPSSPLHHQRAQQNDSQWTKPASATSGPIHLQLTPTRSSPSSQHHLPFQLSRSSSVTFTVLLGYTNRFHAPIWHAILSITSHSDSAVIRFGTREKQQTIPIQTNQNREHDDTLPAPFPRIIHHRSNGRGRLLNRSFSRITASISYRTPFYER